MDFFGSHLISEETHSFFVSIAKHEEGVSSPKHFHSYGCLHYVVSGLYQEKIENLIYEVKPGEVLYKPPEIAHSNNFQFSEAKTCRIEFHDPKRLGVELPTNPLHMAGASFSSLFGQLQSEIVDTDDLSSIAIEGLVWQIVCQLLRNNCGTTEPLKNSKVEQVTQWLEADLRNPPMVSLLATKLGIHRSQLARIFKASTGLTIAEFVRQRRVNMAVELLKRTNKPLSWVALECGFVDQSHFTRSFRKVLGLTPAKWRKTHGS